MMNQVKMVKDPWDWYIYLHENHKNQPNVGNKYQSHGWIYGELVANPLDPMGDG